MLPDLRVMIAGILITIVMPMVAFGVAASFRSASGNSLSPASVTGPGPAEYYWSQFYAPSGVRPADGALRPEAPTRPEAATPETPPKPAPTQAASAPADVPVTHNSTDRIASLPDVVRDVQPVTEPTPANELPDNHPATAKIENSPAPVTAPEIMPAVVAATNAAPAQPELAPEPQQAKLAIVPLPLIRPTSPIPTRKRYAGHVHRRNRSISPQTTDGHFKPLKNSLFENLFGSMGGT